MDGTLAPAPTGCTLISRRAFARPLLGLGALGLGGCTTRAPIENEPAEVPETVPMPEPTPAPEASGAVTESAPAVEAPEPPTETVAEQAAAKRAQRRIEPVDLALSQMRDLRFTGDSAGHKRQ